MVIYGVSAVVWKLRQLEAQLAVSGVATGAIQSRKLIIRGHSSKSNNCGLQVNNFRRLTIEIINRLSSFNNKRCKRVING